jgi:hypothetical protein
MQTDSPVVEILKGVLQVSTPFLIAAFFFGVPWLLWKIVKPKPKPPVANDAELEAIKTPPNFSEGDLFF